MFEDDRTAEPVAAAVSCHRAKACSFFHHAGAVSSVMPAPARRPMQKEPSGLICRSGQHAGRVLPSDRSDTLISSPKETTLSWKTLVKALLLRTATMSTSASWAWIDRNSAQVGQHRASASSDMMADHPRRLGFGDAA